MKKIKRIFLALTLVWAVMACDLNKLENPSALTPDKSDVNFILNGIQLSFANFFSTTSDYGMQMTRMIHFYGPNYEAGFTATNFDGIWSNAYSGVMVNAKTLIPVAESQSLFVHSGIAKVLQAYTMMTLVDYFGTVPFAEALDPNNFNPQADDEASIYAAAVVLLDDAMADFGQTSLALPTNDLYYGGNAALWATLANTLKLRAFLQTRLVDAGAQAGINAALAAPEGVIGVAGAGADFNFKYSTVNANPDSRAPYFSGNYLSGAGTYQANYFMYALYKEKVTVIDPRIRYYFYRQVSATSTDVNELFCIATTAPAHYTSEWPYCAVGDGYWGRDFCDFTGIPPDTFKRTNFGTYPAGGRFDDNSFTAVAPTNGLQGAGILPIYNSANTDFMLAEKELILDSDVAAARAFVLSGISKSITKVKAFGNITSTFVPSATVTTNYLNAVGALYDAATNTDERLEVIVKEYWLSLYGNGIDAFNTYRRTGKPGRLQPGLIPDIGEAYRSFTYPSVYVTRNSNASQKPDNTVQVFWDTNAPGFID